MYIAQIFLLFLLFACLYGYYLAVRKTKLELEIRKNNLDYHCFKCKKKISIDDKSCPYCDFITIYGSRKKKQWLIVIIIISWLYVVFKFMKRGLF